jgi:predicted MFS family arabinose efflux permease
MTEPSSISASREGAPANSPPNPSGGDPQAKKAGWLNGTVLGVGLTSLASDWGHEMATAVLPAFLISIGAGPAWLGAIEGVADGLSSFTKLAAGHWTDRLQRRKPLVVSAYALTAVATGSLAFAGSAIDVMLARSTAWLGRGLRTPGRKALLAAAVPQEAYGRAFGFERMMDTLGAIVAPVTALWLLGATGHSYRRVFLWTLVPSLLAALSFALLVRERPANKPAGSFTAGLRNLPPRFRWFLVAVGVFGLGDFSHTMLILYATRTLAPEMGLAAASSVAVGLYLLHNIFYAAFAYVGGWLSDWASNRWLVLAAGYVTAMAMAALLIVREVFGHAGGAPMGTHRLELAAAFALGGIFVGVNEALEDSIAASLVTREQHGMAFGTMAAVNAVGDFGSSVLIGALWSAYSPTAGFAVAGALFFAGLIVLLRLK